MPPAPLFRWTRDGYFFERSGALTQSELLRKCLTKDDLNLVAVPLHLNRTVQHSCVRAHKNASVRQWCSTTVNAAISMT
jgi:hypothetical protein